MKIFRQDLIERKTRHLDRPLSCPSLFLTIVREPTIERVQCGLLKQVKLKRALFQAYSDLKVNVATSKAVEQGHGPRHGVNIDTTPASLMKKAGVGKSERMMSTYIDVDSVCLPLKHTMQYEVFAFLRVSPSGIGVTSERLSKQVFQGRRSNAAKYFSHEQK
jgi:hypothetical protein